ncbi:hypothetical protein [Streptosporangium sp. 'caverna']|uniref:hypothetical protein n=1 Tax=Streptosporangium sp. 'caverna' TaxID=2202249 RepID=UPI000D7E38EF|nr:hypothetical protein [Streptosporangium sp. 'caverna']AWS44605.1 hypothetical protein DKM19_27960 [Streptosporangium sp. 'caverna']
MTDQPFQPPQSVRTEAGSTVPYPEVVGPRGQRFQVRSLALAFESGLVVQANQPDSDDSESSESGDEAAELPSHAISSFGVDFNATVGFVGNEAWKIGWVQTVESADFWVLYRNGARSARQRTTLPQRMRDGDTRKGCWYGDESREKADPATPVTISLMDDPVVPFHYPRHTGGPGLAALDDWTPAGCGGEKEFWTWLVAVREDADHQPVDVVYLHHTHWKVVFDCVIRGDADTPTVNVPATSGVVLLGEGVGQGGATPVLDGRGVLPRDEVNQVEDLPDEQR